MRIWIFNNYNMLPEQGGLNRHYYFGKYLKMFGHDPIVFVGSHPHNSNDQLIKGHEKYKIFSESPFPWVLIKTCNYEGSKFKRVFSMLQYFFNAKKAAKHFERPDVVIGSSAHPLAALLAIRLGKKYGCQKIVEVRDLWPESIVAYGILKRSNPIIKLLYHFEKWLYINADKVIFTMEGGYDYIKSRGWDSEIGEQKVYYINNGIDLEQFNIDLKNNSIEKTEFEKMLINYTGSIRKANRLDILLDAAKRVKNKAVCIQIWGAGDETKALADRIKTERINNVRIMGRVKKNLIPGIVSMSYANFLDIFDDSVVRFGISPNKLFDYYAAGRPVLLNKLPLYNIADDLSCNCYYQPNAQGIANAIDDLCNLTKEEYDKACGDAHVAAIRYSYETLTQKLVNVLKEKNDGIYIC